MKKSFFSSMIILSAVNLVTASSPLHAALPPLYQSLHEYQELLASPQLTQKLNSADLIEDIQRHEGGFLIKTSKHTLQVDVVNEPQEMPGPVRFHLIFHEAVSLEVMPSPSY